MNKKAECKPVGHAPYLSINNNRCFFYSFNFLILSFNMYEEFFFYSLVTVYKRVQSLVHISIGLINDALIFCMYM